jgi:hypothetical protein
MKPIRTDPATAYPLSFPTRQDAEAFIARQGCQRTADPEYVPNGLARMALYL